MWANEQQDLISHYACCNWVEVLTDSSVFPWDVASMTFGFIASYWFMRNSFYTGITSPYSRPLCELLVSIIED